VTLLAAGSGLPALLRQFGATGAPPFVAAMNVLLNRSAGDTAVAARGRSGRMLTAVPWRGHWLVGTAQSPGPVPETAAAPSRAEVEALLADANHAFPFLSVTAADVRLVQYGLTPATVQHHGRADFLSDARLISHAGQHAAGLFSLVGVKFTTARAAAAQAITDIVRDAGGPASRCGTADHPLPYAEAVDAHALIAAACRDLGLALPPDVVTHLADWYGSEAPDVLACAAARDLAHRLTDEHPILAGEIAYAATHADARHLDDAVLRRTPLGATGDPGSRALEAAADIMGAIRGWSDADRALEIARVRARYALPTA
jgi:glycerol-3-phosphate dehydrogenase